MQRFIYLLFLSLLAAASLAQPAPKGIKTVVGGKAPEGTERRLALVIGNQAYLKPSDRLNSPLNDADDMAAKLDRLGFEIIQKKNLNRLSFEEAIDEFAAKLANYDVGLFYYSGHGLRGTDGQNYLVPTDANMVYQTQVISQCVSLKRLLDGMEGAQLKVSLALLDACRNNNLMSLKKETGSTMNLTIPNNAPGSFVAYSTRDGRPSYEVPGLRNSLFTSELLNHLDKPNLGIRSMMDLTKQGVVQRCRSLNLAQAEAQIPGRYDELDADFVFVQTPSPTKWVDDATKPDRDLPPFMEMVRIPGGSFDMGSADGEADEKPVHVVTVSSFLMGKYEVTVSQFAQFVAETSYQTDAEKGGSSRLWNPKTNKYADSTGINWRYDALGRRRLAGEYNHPVVHVSHNDALAFCSWLSKKTGKTYRLPTEAEWEYAAGNGTAHTTYSWGASDPSKAAGGNVADETFGATFNGTITYTIFKGYTDGYATTSPVGVLAANRLGLYDMTGNVLEWCQDWYDSAYYANSSGSVNPAGPTTGTYRVLRGGSWLNYPRFCRVADRNSSTPTYRDFHVGFRVVSQLQ